MPLELPQLAPPKKAVPDWLRAEMLKRGISLNAQAGKWLLGCCCLSTVHKSSQLSLYTAQALVGFLKQGRISAPFPSVGGLASH